LAWKDVVPLKPVEKKPTELIYTARADGSVEANMSVMELVEARMRKRRMQDD
jgi:hypothetical protein